MLNDTVKGQIDTLIQKSDVVLFMKGNKHFPQCGFSAQVLGVLKELGVPFETVNVLSDPGLRDGIKEYSSWPTIPQLYVKGEFVGGCDIVKEMFANGELQEKLGIKEEPVAPPSVTVDAGAAKAINAAREADGDELRLEISPSFEYELYFGPKQAGDIEVKAGDVTVLFDKQSAKRANGLSIAWVDAPGGGAFRIENPNEPPRVKPLSVGELKSWMDSGKAFELFDVRGEDERAKASIEAAHALDGAGEKRLQGLPKDATIVMMCHHGMRSRTAGERLVADGYKNIYNLDGGIDAWSVKVDSKVARY